MKFKKAYLLLFFSLLTYHSFAQSAKDSTHIRAIYTQALQNPVGYQWLDFLSNQIGGRLSGSPQAAAAVNFTYQVMDTLGLDRVFLQEVMVPHWVRGKKEVGKMISAKYGSKEFPVCALGNSVGTGTEGLAASVIEVISFEELAKLGKEKVQGKIVFYNTPMNPSYVRTFQAYGESAKYRFSGPSEAAKLGAVGAIVRSLTTQLDDYPHTGSLGYQLNTPQIPAIAISTNGAEELSLRLKHDPTLSFYIETHCKMLEDALSYNVIGEIKGSEFPDEIIVVGGHLDSWDIGDGSHDDGAGVVQSMDVLRILKALDFKPKRTIRAVMFMNEENGLKGGRKYAELAEENKENHIAAIESDAGGFTPRNIGITDDERGIDFYLRWNELLAPYDISIKSGGGGADISPLRNQGTVQISLIPDSQRYFDLHHTEQDTFDKVNQRELQLGAAAMATFVYLLSEYGVDK
jgi:hypothetical protein